MLKFMNNKIYIVIFIIIVIDVSSKIENFCFNTEDNCVFASKNSNSFHNDNEHETTQHSTTYKQHKINSNFNQPSIFEFLKSYLSNIINSQSNEMLKYINGFKFIIQSITNLYSKAKNEQYNNIKENIRDLLSQQNEEIIQTQNHNNTEIHLRDLSRGYLTHFNNSDYYDSMYCTSDINLKANYYLYFCNNNQVNKTTFTNLSKDSNNKCDFTVNIVKLCLCPVTYKNCLRESPEVMCIINQLTVNNNKYNLTKFKNTFYNEYLKDESLPLSESPFNYTISLKCGAPNSPSNNQLNFYLSSPKDSHFEILSTHYTSKYTGDKKNLTLQDIENPKNELLHYFIDKPSFKVYDNMTLELTLSIYDMQWLLPMKQTKFTIPQEQAKKLLSGEQSFEFEIDYRKLLESESNDDVFKGNKYPYMRNGDLSYYEIKISDVENSNLVFFSYRGDVNIFK